MSDKMDTKAEPPSKPDSTPGPGDGIRKIKTTSVFRAVNFELYVKPNKGIMVAGIVAISSCIAYLTFMNIQSANKKSYKAISEDGSAVLMEKTSKWD